MIKTCVTFTAVMPKLIVEAGETAVAVQFYKSAFAAEQLSREIPLKGKADQELPLVVSAELKLGSPVHIVSDQTDGSDAPAAPPCYCLAVQEREYNSKILAA